MTTTVERRVWSRDDAQPPPHAAYLAFYVAHPLYRESLDFEAYFAVLTSDGPLSDADLGLIESQVVPEPIPPCRICGRELSPGSMGGGKATEYYCSGYIDDPEHENQILRDPTWDPMNTSYGLSLHHVWSGYTHSHSGNALAARLLKEVHRLRSIEHVPAS